MARARGWYTASATSGSSMVDGVVGGITLTTGLTDATLLRTRAFVGLAHAADDAPPFVPGNACSPYVVRLLVTAADDAPESGWQFEASGNDDVVFEPLIWQPALFVPANVDFGRPEACFSNAYPGSGVIDSHAQRHLPGEADVLLSVWIGHAPDTGSAADPLFTAQYWFRCLIESTI